MDVNKVLKLKQFKALDLEEKNGEILLKGELQETNKSCPNCKKEGEKPHQYEKRKMRTTPLNGQFTYLVFTVKAYLCTNCRHRFLERGDFYEKHQRHTLDYEKYIYKLVKSNSINGIAEMEEMSWGTINEIFLKGGEI